MPLLLFTLVALVAYVLTLDGASQGLRVYLMPDFKTALSADLIIKALGSAFFSLSLGVGTMLIYGSYISDKENLPVAGGLVTAVDIGIAVLAGFLVLPAMYVALNNGVEIFAADGALLSEDTLIFTVLPALFSSMGAVGWIISFTFFFLMSIAALTSSISMLEVPVAYTIENHGVERRKAVVLIGGAIALISVVILLNFSALFGLVISLTTRYSQPLLGFMFCIYVGWVWHRDSVLGELKKGAPNIADGLFWKIWPWHLRLVCPAIILLIFVQSLR
jgi:NSS family neurotransmitter:Na+ symporter